MPSIPVVVDVSMYDILPVVQPQASSRRKKPARELLNADNGAAEAGGTGRSPQAATTAKNARVGAAAGAATATGKKDASHSPAVNKTKTSQPPFRQANTGYAPLLRAHHRERGVGGDAAVAAPSDARKHIALHGVTHGTGRTSVAAPAAASVADPGTCNPQAAFDAQAVDFFGLSDAYEEAACVPPPPASSAEATAFAEMATAGSQKPAPPQQQRPTTQPSVASQAPQQPQPVPQWPLLLQPQPPAPEQVDSHRLSSESNANAAQWTPRPANSGGPHWPRPRANSSLPPRHHPLKSASPQVRASRPLHRKYPLPSGQESLPSHVSHVSERDYKWGSEMEQLHFRKRWHEAEEVEAEHQQQLRPPEVAAVPACNASVGLGLEPQPFVSLMGPASGVSAGGNRRLVPPGLEKELGGAPGPAQFHSQLAKEPQVQAQQQDLPPHLRQVGHQQRAQTPLTHSSSAQPQSPSQPQFQRQPQVQSHAQPSAISPSGAVTAVAAAGTAAVRSSAAAPIGPSAAASRLEEALATPAASGSATAATTEVVAEPTEVAIAVLPLSGCVTVSSQAPTGLSKVRNSATAAAAMTSVAQTSTTQLPGVPGLAAVETTAGAPALEQFAAPPVTNAVAASTAPITAASSEPEAAAPALALTKVNPHTLSLTLNLQHRDARRQLEQMLKMLVEREEEEGEPSVAVTASEPDGSRGSPSRAVAPPPPPQFESMPSLRSRPSPPPPAQERMMQSVEAQGLSVPSTTAQVKPARAAAATATAPQPVGPPAAPEGATATRTLSIAVKPEPNLGDENGRSVGLMESALNPVGKLATSPNTVAAGYMPQLNTFCFKVYPLSCFLCPSYSPEVAVEDLGLQRSTDLPVMVRGEDDDDAEAVLVSDSEDMVEGAEDGSGPGVGGRGAAAGAVVGLAAHSSQAKCADGVTAFNESAMTMLLNLLHV